MKVGFSSLHPWSCFLFFASQFCVLTASDHPAMLALAFLLALACDLRFRGREALKTLFAFYLPLALFCAAFNSIFSHYGVTPLFTLPGGNSYTLESLLYGLVFGVKLIVALMWLDSFNVIITPEKFIFLFGRLSPRTALVVSMSLRFIPLFRQQSREISEAHYAAGAESKRFRLRLRHAVHNASILITWILERGIDTADSMAARGYGSGKRSRYSPYRFRADDAAALALCALFVLFAVLSRKAMSCAYNPVIRICAPDTVSLVFIALLVLSGAFPLIYDITEKKRWKQ